MATPNLVRYTATLTDNFGNPISGAVVIVAASQGGALATLTADNGAPITTLVSDQFGGIVFNTYAGTYDLTYVLGNRTLRIDHAVAIGVTSNAGNIVVVDTLSNTPGTVLSSPGLMTVVTGLQGSINTNAGNISTLQTQVGNYFGSITGLQTQINTTNGNVSTLQTIAATHTNQISTNASNITSLQTNYGTLSGRVTTNASAIGTLQTNVGTNTSAISTLQTTVSGNSSAIGTLQTSVGANASAISTLQTTVSGNTSAINSISGTVTTLQGTVSGQATSIGNLFGSVLSLQNQANTNGTNITALQTVNTAAQFANIIVPTSTQGIQTTGNINIGDYGEGAFKSVAQQPSHQGFIKDNAGRFFELTGEFCTPDQFIRPGDVDDGPSFQRASDYMAARNVLFLLLAPRVYDTRSFAVTFNTPVQMIGRGFSEGGNVGGFTSNIAGNSSPVAGTWICCGQTGDRAFKFNSTSTRGSRIDRIGFVQPHPNPANGWAPTPYDYIICTENALGGLEIGDVMMFGIRAGILSNNSGRLFVQRLRGQFFFNAIQIDQSLDVPTLANMHHWTFETSLVPIISYQQQNLQTIILRRCDGFFAGKLFGLGQSRMLSLANGTNSVPGPPTAISIDTFYADCTQVGIYSAANGAFGHINDFCSSGEDITTGTGSPQANSAGLQYDPSCQNNLFTFNKFRVERTTLGAYVNQGGTTNRMETNWSMLRSTFASQQFVSSSGPPANLLRPPFTDSTATTLGTMGTDYTVVNGDEIVYTYQTTTDANGNVTIAHGLGNNGVYGLVTANAFVKGSNGNANMMTFTGMDGVNASFGVVGYANSTVRITIIVRRYPTAW